jgi:hypothetical protein
MVFQLVFQQSFPVFTIRKECAWGVTQGWGWQSPRTPVQKTTPRTKSLLYNTLFCKFVSADTLPARPGARRPSDWVQRQDVISKGAGFPSLVALPAVPLVLSGASGGEPNLHGNLCRCGWLPAAGGTAGAAIVWAAHHHQQALHLNVSGSIEAVRVVPVPGPRHYGPKQAVRTQQPAVPCIAAASVRPQGGGAPRHTHTH